ncbi:hypothetical protein PAXRUDRAFT_22157 [Paxillus rubicundulus Ve08.2h10]|uniref:Uncharacterized protein n=1 Tax=Paxillus rubicundulus Ve08.2h10 TaxID=930991 RepID=A0A0D0CNJ2_9AGAM|nr:hypothetical protein PAXRUDRAFT_22157 [Paxillus rubicundulus Ve08.2h10]
MGPSEVQLSHKANALFAHRDLLKDAAKYNNRCLDLENLIPSFTVDAIQPTTSADGYTY